jgi:NADP-dependent 3-hydroxy acid dehydrogenase YdfG
VSLAELRDLSGTTVAITGASSGIGRAAARALADAGANVVLGARRAERLDELVDQLEAGRAVGVPCDVRVAADNQRLVSTAVDRFGALDSFVANAGLGSYGGILDHTDEELVEMVEANFLGTVWGVRAAVAAMRKQGGGGDVVVVASVAGLRGGGNEAVYAATKFAQVGLAGAVDREVREEGIRLTAICPAAVATEFAIGHGRTEGDPWLDEVLKAEDVAAAIVTTLSQPRRMRTTVWAMWSMVEAS